MTTSLIHIVDDDEAMRRSVGVLLNVAGFAVRSYERAEQLLEALGRMNGDCVLADICMPEIDGLEMLTRIRGAGSAVPVVMMTGKGDVDTAVRAMKLGAWDFVEKPFATQVLVQAIRSAFLRGDDGLSPDASMRVFGERVRRLTDRERQVFERLLLGRTNKEIGLDLSISPRTVEVHRAKVMLKTGCRSVPDLVRTAVRSGIS